MEFYLLSIKDTAGKTTEMRIFSRIDDARIYGDTRTGADGYVEIGDGNVHALKEGVGSVYRICPLSDMLSNAKRERGMLINLKAFS